MYPAQKNVKTLWVILSFLWIPIALVTANWLNNIPTGTDDNVVIELCQHTPNGIPALFASNAKPCIASRQNYGLPFTYKRVYTLKEPIISPGFPEPTKTTTVTRYVGLFGEILTLTDSYTKMGGNYLQSWNVISLFLAPFIISGVLFFARKKLNSNIRIS